MATNPTVREAFEALREQQDNLPNFRAYGKLVLTQKNGVTQQLRGRIDFLVPDTITIRGDKPPFGTRVFELSAHGNSWSVFLPFENISLDSHRSGSASVVSVEPAREFFCFLNWEKLEQRRGTMESEAGNTFTVKLSERGFTRRITFTGQPWRIVQSDIASRWGRKLFSVRFEDYAKFDTIYLPQRIYVDLHTIGFRMSFEDLVYHQNVAP